MEKNAINSDTSLDWTEWDPMREDYQSPRNTLALSPDKDSLSTITGQTRPIASKVGDVPICEHFARFGKCADAYFCSKVHVDSLTVERIWSIQSGYQRRKDRVCLDYTYLSPIELEPSKKLLLTSITNPILPNDFYFIAPFHDVDFTNSSDEDLEFYLKSVKTNSLIKTKIELIHNKLHALFGHDYRIDNINDEIYVGQLVACKLRDGLFRRAMVLEIPDLAFDKFDYKLQLLDIGTEVESPRELIYDIKAECLSEPPSAINARLNLKPPSGALNWPDEALDFFKQYVRTRNFTFCTVHDYSTQDRIFTVDIYDLETRESLTETLVRMGMAEKCSF